jgi:hypothetical protein
MHLTQDGFQWWAFTKTENNILIYSISYTSYHLNLAVRALPSRSKEGLATYSLARGESCGSGNNIHIISLSRTLRALGSEEPENFDGVIESPRQWINVSGQ